MYMRMPLSSSQLPIEGKCHVDDDKLHLKFPFTGIEFELPKLEEKDFDFSLHAARGKMNIAIKYVEDLKCYQGKGTLEEESEPSLSFIFFDDDSPLNKLV